MNNYCTNCGKKLNNGDLVCSSCGTPIVDLPYNYIYKSPKEIEKKKEIKRNMFIIGIVLLCLMIVCFVIFMIHRSKVNNLKDEYVKPYLEQNYDGVNYSVKYDSGGKCIISGNCYPYPLEGCNERCEYEYLDEKECSSYYYFVKTDEESFFVTVFYRNKTYSVVEGKNIYGYNKD